MMVERKPMVVSTGRDVRYSAPEDYEERREAARAKAFLGLAAIDERFFYAIYIEVAGLSNASSLV